MVRSISCNKLCRARQFLTSDVFCSWCEFRVGMVQRESVLHPRTLLDISLIRYYCACTSRCLALCRSAIGVWCPDTSLQNIEYAISHCGWLQVVAEFDIDLSTNFALFRSPAYRDELTQAHLNMQLKTIPIR